MANYLEEQKKKQQEEAQAYQPQQTGAYNVAGMSEATQKQLQQAQTGYQPNEKTQAAQQSLQQVQAQRPQTYNSKYSAALDGILEQIQNPKDFKYSFNDDELFKSYADVLTQQAKQASLNAQGQAAALTGGYGNSYAQAAGQQAYQQAILPLYDRGMELASMARQNYENDRANTYNQLAALQGMDESEYGRYRDTMADWRQDEQNAQENYRYENEFGYNTYADMLNRAMNIGAMEADSYRADQDEAYRRDSLAQNQAQFEATNKLDWAQLEEKQREFDADLSEEQRQYNQNYAMNLCSSILANGQIPSNELLVAAGLSLEDAKKLIAQVTGGGTPQKPVAETTPSAKPMTFEEANQLIFQSTPDSVTLGDLGANANAGMTVGEYKAKLEQAIADRDAAKSNSSVLSTLQNAGNRTSYSGTAKETVSNIPSQMEYIEWLKKQAKK